MSPGEQTEIKSDVEDVLPVDSSDIVAMFEEQWAVNVEVSCRMPASSGAKVDRNSAQQVRDAETKSGPNPSRGKQPRTTKRHLREVPREPDEASSLMFDDGDLARHLGDADEDQLWGPDVPASEAGARLMSIHFEESV